MPRPLSSYAQYLIEDILKSHYPSAKAKRMFGGYGVYLESLMAGILDEDEFFIKVTTESRERLKDLGSRPFEYIRRGQAVTIDGYWLVSAENLEDGQLMAYLCSQALLAQKEKKTLASKARRSKSPRKRN